MILIEDFDNKFEKNKHWERHKSDFPELSNADEYEQRANKMAMQRANKSTAKGGVVGYIRKDNRVVYYDYKTREYLIWKVEFKKPLIISFYKISPYQYEKYRDRGTDSNGDLAKMKSELPWNKNK